MKLFFLHVKIVWCAPVDSKLWVWLPNDGNHHFMDRNLQYITKNHQDKFINKIFLPHFGYMWVSISAMNVLKAYLILRLKILNAVDKFKPLVVLNHVRYCFIFI